MNPNGNGHMKPSPIPMRGPAGTVVGQSQVIDLKKCIRDASVGAAQAVKEMVEGGELAHGLDAATYQVAMELLLEPVKASIQISAQMQAQQAMMRAQGLIG